MPTLVDQSLPLAVVTGANRGIGEEVALALARSGKYRVCAVCRDAEAAARMSEALGFKGITCDLANDTPVIEEPVALLVNNAGVCLEEWTPENYCESIQVNVAAPLALLRTLTFVKGARIVNVTSSYGHLGNLTPTYRKQVVAAKDFDTLLKIPYTDDDDLRFNYLGLFKLSKAMLNQITFIATKQYPDLIFFAVCPGWVNTRQGGDDAPRSPKEAADIILFAIFDAPAEKSGSFIKDKLIHNLSYV